MTTDVTQMAGKNRISLRPDLYKAGYLPQLKHFGGAGLRITDAAES